MHDIETDAKPAQEARERYVREPIDYRRKTPTSYMEKGYFTPGDRSAADFDARMHSDEDLEKAMQEGNEKDQGT